MVESPTYEQLRAEIEVRLGPSEVAHSVAVAETAAELAGLYGVDVEAARVAGLLHDWAREMTGDELLAAAEEYGIEPTQVDRDVPYLLHAQVGGEALRRAFPGIDAQVLRAVELHTTGAVEMAPLDKVVYIADMIEPQRSFRGVDELREIVGSADLDEAFIAAYSHSLSHLLRKRRRIHPRTVEVWNAIVSKERA